MSRLQALATSGRLQHVRPGLDLFDRSGSLGDRWTVRELASCWVVASGISAAAGSDRWTFIVWQIMPCLLAVVRELSSQEIRDLQVPFLRDGAGRQSPWAILAVNQHIAEPLFVAFIAIRCACSLFEPALAPC
jgi:hypothetical protein